MIANEAIIGNVISAVLNVSRITENVLIPIVTRWIFRRNELDDLIKSARLDEDGTLWIELNDQDIVEDYKMIDKINRVIVASGVWCKMFYLENEND